MTPVAATIALELRRTLWCANCEWIFSPQPACPHCASPYLYPLSAWLDRAREQEGGQ